MALVGLGEPQGPAAARRVMLAAADTIQPCEVFPMSKRIALVMSALLMAAGSAGAASAANAQKAPHVGHPHTQASLQCSAAADAKGLHGKARAAFRRDCLHKATAHRATYHKQAPAKPMHPATTHTMSRTPADKT
jgi:hypothetical protein